MAKQPNVMLIVCDQMRGDCLSIEGHPDIKTPYLDTMAAEGMLFDRAYSACPTCIPARAALFTGMDQRNHGRTGYKDGVPWEYDHMLAEEFANSGYQTACIGKMHVHPPRLQCGFQTIKLHDGYIGYYRKSSRPKWMHQDCSDDYLRFLRDELGPDADVDASGAQRNSWVTHPWIYEERLHPTNWVANEAIRSLETRDRTKPFFIMASFVRPHPPFDAPYSYYEGYGRRSLRPPARGDWDDHEACIHSGMIADGVHGCNNETMRHEAMAGYYACITQIDHQVGRIIAALKNDESYEDTIIVFTSDHGELLFDHDLFRKTLPYEGSTHVPLIFRVGKKVAKTQAGRSDSIVELRDIMPTLLELCGLPIPGCVDGLSLKDEIFGIGKIEREYLHGEHDGSMELANQYIVTKKDKYVWFPKKDVEQYFDLSQGRDERHNAIDETERSDRIAYLRGLMIKELADRQEMSINLKQLRARAGSE